MNRDSRKEANFVIQGSILAAAGIIVRLIGILYRIPMTNIIGDEGMGYYSTAFNVYNIMLILSSYSLPLAVSKMVSARLAKGEYRNAARVLVSALVYATIVGGAACLITWNMAEFFAGTVFKTPLCVYALRSLAPTIWVMAYLGVLRGFFQGHGTMVPTAISQILEQIVNAVISVVAASALFKTGLAALEAGKTGNYPQAYGAAGGTIGTGAGAFSAFLFVLFLLFLYRPVFRRRYRADRKGTPDSYALVSRTLFFTVVPVILSSAVYNINSVLDNSIMAYGMDAAGQGEEFLGLWGIYNNKYMLLVHVPLAMANSLSSSLIPSISGALSRNDREAVLEKIGLVIRVAMLIAMPSMIGMAVLSSPIMNLLFRTGNNAEAARMLTIGSAAVVFLSLSTVSNAILQGISRMKTPVKNSAIALVLHVIALLIFLFVFRMGIYSMVFASILFALFVCVLNNVAITRFTGYRQEWKKTFLIPAAAAAVMGIVTKLVYIAACEVGHPGPAATLASIGAAVLVYGLLLLRLHAIEKEELRSIRGGTRVIQIAEKLRLM